MVLRGRIGEVKEGGDRAKKREEEGREAGEGDEGHGEGQIISEPGCVHRRAGECGIYCQLGLTTEHCPKRVLPAP